MAKRSQTLWSLGVRAEPTHFFPTAHMRLTTFFKKLLRWELAVFLLSGALTLLHGSDKNFFVMDGHQSTIFVDGPVARSQNTVFYYTCWVTLVIFILGIAATALFSLFSRSNLSMAKVMSLSMSFSFDKPVFAHKTGYILILVKPGIVLTSLT